VISKLQDDSRELSASATTDGAACNYCEGTGWQTYAFIGAKGNENTAVRACACTATPLEVRSLVFFCEPQWRKRKHSAIWERAT
jgi:hypothetical protein